MSKDYDLVMDGHPSIYNGMSRKLKIYFSEPDKGVTESTGLLLLISGFGGHSNSNVYKKMRSLFSDQYDLVTVQCDYYGWEFMQSATEIVFDENEFRKVFSPSDIAKATQNGKLDFQRLLTLNSSVSGSINCSAKMNEDLSNFNDMGLMQAIDNITAVSIVMEILKSNDLYFNSRKVIIYGQSHGAYLAYLSNALAPFMFSLIVDNSAWLKPVYLTSNRVLSQIIGKLMLNTIFDYFAKGISLDHEISDLTMLYGKFINSCEIVSFHGSEDTLVPLIKKRSFCSNIPRCIFHEITPRKVDGKMFKAATHGLGADFLELFDYSLKKSNGIFGEYNVQKDISFTNVNIKTSKHSYVVDYSKQIPILSIED